MVTSNQPLRIEWRAAVSDGELVDLTRSHGGEPKVGWWDRVRPYSLGWVTARTGVGELVGFVNVAWDGGDQAFLIDHQDSIYSPAAGPGCRGRWPRDR